MAAQEPEPSLITTLALFEYLLEHHDWYSAENNPIFTVICDGLERLILKGREYRPSASMKCYSLFRLRDTGENKSTGALVENVAFKNRCSACRNRYVNRISQRVPPETGHETAFLDTISCDLVFRNHNRSLRIMFLYFVYLADGKNTKGRVADSWKSVEYVLGDLETIGMKESIPASFTLHDQDAQHVKENIMNIFKLYKGASRELREIEKRTNLAPLPFIYPHVQGAYVQRHLLIVWASRIYVVLVAIGSLFVGIFNIANRDNIFERVFDSVQFTTVSLFTVFGLFKLSSEDPSVVRNTFLGSRVLCTAADVVKAAGFESEVELKKRLAVTNERQEWLNPQGAAFVVAGTGKGIALSPGILPRHVYEMGCDFDGNRYYRPQDREGYLIEYGGWARAHLRACDRKHLHHSPDGTWAISLLSGISEL